jgi:hypothetical protein
MRPEAAANAQLAGHDLSQALPACPRCHSAMVVRATRGGHSAGRLFWGCSRAPACNGTRGVASGQALRPAAADATVQPIFEWERQRENNMPDSAVDRLLGGFGRLIGRRPRQRLPLPALEPAPRHVATLIDHGYVILTNRRLSFARAWMDQVVIGPTGVFVVGSKPWRGQLAAAEDELYVDGRRRVGATDDVSHAAQAADQALAHELKPLGAPVFGVLCIEHSAAPWFKATVQGVLVTNGRALSRAIREGQPILGPETVVRLALAADRLLE